MNEPAAAQRTPVADANPEGRSGAATLARVTGAAGFITLLPSSAHLSSTAIRTSR
jgi:hypothetical protein